MIRLFPEINKIIILYSTSCHRTWNVHTIYMLPRKHFLLACGQLTIIIILLKNSFFFSQKTSHGWYSFTLWVKRIQHDPMQFLLLSSGWIVFGVTNYTWNYHKKWLDVIISEPCVYAPKILQQWGDYNVFQNVIYPTARLFVDEYHIEFLTF